MRGKLGRTRNHNQERERKGERQPFREIKVKLTTLSRSLHSIARPLQRVKGHLTGEHVPLLEEDARGDDSESGEHDVVDGRD